ncbi:glutaredoxin-related protein 5, mitochondrial [Eurytemora carolleeae]|uniref:glutaredoxin-related protein 5, mitochondrial n=1 Tax=Eurytemora carolleeae TaxID=1294199 RepID=UPI000C776465|nr:glutaredoxin-related protein 5, mitochondrial [Eurytemora carolleeae]|eukprot:XP_023328011.1 glutaredoxin-related protein 5, mitochondrial-like [Eurytemora affinis]
MILIHFREKMSVRNCIRLGQNLRFDRLRSTVGGYRFLPGFSLTLKSSPGFNHNLSPSFPVRCFAGEARNIEDEIKKLVSKEKVVVFMKGVPDAPKCGFSNAVVQFDYLIKVYMEGEFVGGCDILLQMHQNGELVEELKKIGITSALLAEEEKK